MNITTHTTSTSTRLLTAALLTAGIASSAVATPASAAAGQTGVRTVCATSTSVMQEPGKTFTGTLFKDNTIRVRKVSKSGTWAYGFARGHAQKTGWVKTADLCK